MDPSSRVCSRCGGEAGEHRFCPECGLNLSELRELPTRAEWESKESRQRSDATDGKIVTGGSVEGRPSLGLVPALLARWRSFSSKAQAGIVGVLILAVGVGLAIAIETKNDKGSASSAESGGGASESEATDIDKCVASWNSGVTENVRSLVKNIGGASLSGGGAQLYASTGYSADFPDRCLVTIANPDIRQAVQVQEDSSGSFILSKTASLGELPDSVKQWNAGVDKDGFLTAGSP